MRKIFLKLILMKCDINKVLLDKHIMNLNKNYNQLKNINIEDRYNDLIQSRNIPLVENVTNNEIKDNPLLISNQLIRNYC